ncbi:hypothetical protein [Streptobacillus moniliformis]|uniref:hypothetical protein n=1 Tax=Streptobacillus moniliformis TaxID=34105 RepID=UPI0007E426C4|nr:hypothetical protein [Streptobacillus moniliformis]
MKKSLLIFLTIMMSIISFTGYRVDGSFSYGLEELGENDNSIKHQLILSLGFMPEYRYEKTSKLDFTFGPRISLTGGVAISELGTVGRGSLNLTLRGEANYELLNNIKVFGGAELGVGMFLEHAKGIGIKMDGNHGAIAKGIVGLKIDKYNIGLVSGYENKFVIGIETGYTF